MCAGIATLFGPPTLAGLCYLVWERGRAAVSTTLAKQTASTYATGIAALVGAYKAQSVLIFRHFDALGTASWRQTADVLGEPLKVQTWRQFYKLAGPPVLARTAGVVVSFYCAGLAQGYAAHRWNPPAPEQPVRVTALPRAAGGGGAKAGAASASAGAVPAAAVSPAGPGPVKAAPGPVKAAPRRDLTFDEFQRELAAEKGAAAQRQAEAGGAASGARAAALSERLRQQ